MPTVTFGTGQKVNFAKTPTQQDIDEVATKLGINKPVQPTISPVAPDLGYQPMTPLFKAAGTQGTYAGSLLEGAKAVANVPLKAAQNIEKGLIGVPSDIYKTVKETYKLGEQTTGMTGPKAVVKAGFDTAGTAVDMLAIKPLTAIGNTILGGVQAGIKKLTGINIPDAEAQKTFALVSDKVKNPILTFGDFMEGLNKIAIEDPTMIPLAMQGVASSYAKATGKPEVDLISKIATPVTKTVNLFKKPVDLTNVVAPALTPKKMDEAIKYGDVKAKISPITKQQTPDFSGNPEIQKLAQVAKDNGLKPGNLPAKNLEINNQAIKRVANNVAEPLLRGNKRLTNFEDIRKYTDGVEPPFVLKSEPVALSSFNQLKERFLSVLADSIKKSQSSTGKFGTGKRPMSGTVDLNELWAPGKTIDRMISDELGNAVWGTPQYTGIKAAAMAIRDVPRQFISDSLRFPGQMEKIVQMREVANTLAKKGIEFGLPEQKLYMKQMGIISTPEASAVANTWEKSMDTLHSLLDIRNNLAPKVRVGMGTNAVGRFFKANPVTAGIIQKGAETTGLGAVVNLLK